MHHVLQEKDDPASDSAADPGAADLDEDGDLIVDRRCTPASSTAVGSQLQIHHHLATPLPQVGLQVRMTPSFYDALTPACIGYCELDMCICPSIM